MAYSWEKESIEKYGKELTEDLIKRQKEHEEKNKNNDCDNCGHKNEGAIVEWSKGKPVLIHFGLWTDDYCNYCKRPME